jgi:hypothetical protein
MSIDSLTEIHHTPVVKEVLTISKAPKWSGTELSRRGIQTTKVAFTIAKIVQ